MKIRGVPDDEIFLAKIIQNAKGRGMGHSRTNMYSDDTGKSCHRELAVSCCAIGSAFLEKDTKEYPASHFGCDGLTQGNGYDLFDYSMVTGDYFVVGQCFADAMQDE